MVSVRILLRVLFPQIGHRIQLLHRGTIILYIFQPDTWMKYADGNRGPALAAHFPGLAICTQCGTTRFHSS